MVLTIVSISLEIKEQIKRDAQVEALRSAFLTQAEAIEREEARQEVVGDTFEPMPDDYYEALELLAHLIYSEVGNEGEASMWYAGSVVMNRIKHKEYPNNLYDVIYQKGQYEVTWNGGLYKEDPSDIAYEVAAELLNSGSILPEEVIYQAEFTQGKGIYEKIGRTYYCY